MNTKIEGTDLEVFYITRQYSDVLQITINCHHTGDNRRSGTFGCWARAQATGTELPILGSAEEAVSGDSSSRKVTITFDTETLLGSGNVVASESAELLARVLCDRLMKTVPPSVKAPEVLLSLSLPEDVRTLDMKLLRSIASVITPSEQPKRD